MKHPMAVPGLGLVACVFALLACGGDGPPEPEADSLGILVHDCPVAESAPESDSRAWEATLGWRDGQLVLFAAADGEVWAQGPSFSDEVVDMALDAAGARLWIVTEDDSGEGSELWSVRVRQPVGETSRPLDGQWVGDVFGAPRSRAWIDGRGRVLPIDGGVVFFEEGYGERWRFFSGDGGFARSVAAWRPASVWFRQEVIGTTVYALTHGSLPGLHKMRGRIEPPTLFDPVVEVLGVRPGSWPSSARLKPGAHGGMYLADIESERVVVARLGGEGDLRRAALPVAAARIEQLAVMAGPSSEAGLPWDRLALLLSEPPSVVVIEVRPGTEPSVLEHRWAHAPLASDPVVQDRFFGRFLIAGGDRLLAATRAGVQSFSLRHAAATLRLTRQIDFEGSALRGPVVAADGRDG